jgi:ABC-2 type transport system permease protein
MAQQLESIPEQSSREGSPWTGLWAVVAKEMADHLTSVRMYILELLILITAGGTIFSALPSIRSARDDGFLFLKLFTTSKDPLPAFVGFLGFLVPLVAISLAFDAVNSEFNQRTLSRVLAQPIYRDAFLMGKFLAGLFTIALVLASIWLLIIGLGIFSLGIAPSAEEVGRGLMFLLVAIFYGGIWLALALLFSTIFRQPATAALASIAIWLFFMVFWGMLTNMVGEALRPIRQNTVSEIVGQIELIQDLDRISPDTLFVEATIGLLNPTTRSFGVVLPSQMQGAVSGSPLPLGQSVLLIWPQLTSLIAATILLFTGAYVRFQRQEIRA